MSDSVPTRSYEPQPMETSGVGMPPELTPLLESLARNAHDVWARQRLREGWVYGPRRDDDAKWHPCLVPYEELPESEKQYDRMMAREILAAILLMGYRIVPPHAPDVNRNESVAGAAASLVDAPAIAKGIRASHHARELLATWNSHDESAWARHPELYPALARRFIQLGEPLLAREVLRQVSAAHSDDLRLRHLNGLALARSGATLQARAEAESIIRALNAEGSHASSTLYEDAYGLLGRVSKDLALDEDDAAERRRYLAESFAAYEHAFTVTKRAYSGINAATVALLRGDTARSMELARAAREATLADMQSDEDPTEDFWQLATLGEAALLLGETEEAARRYREALGHTANVGLADIGNSRRQIRLILAARNADLRWADEVLPLPSVVVFAGPHTDAPGRALPRFPPDAEPRVREVLRERLDALDARVGFSGAASGSDIIFQEVMQERGAETYVVLPYGEAEFLETSVDDSWRDRFREVMDAATECMVATEQRSVEQRVLFGYAHQLVLGLAAIHARWLDARLVPLAILDRSPHGESGTAAAVASWRHARHHVEIIDIHDAIESVTTNASGQ